MTGLVLLAAVGYELAVRPLPLWVLLVVLAAVYVSSAVPRRRA